MLTGLPTREVAGLELTVTSLDETLRALRTQAQAERGTSVHLVNSYSAVMADRDRQYAAALDDEHATLLPDGTPLVWLSRVGGGRTLFGVRGPTLMRRALLEGGISGRRHYLLGSTPENLERLAAAMTAAGQGAELCGSYSPPFGPLEGDEWEQIVQRIRQAEADIVWVGLGTPLQDLVSVRLARETGAVVVAVGAAFDFLAGTKREAPRWLQGTGLEWLYRLVTEPRRLWRRYLLGNLQFLWIAIRSWRCST